MEIDYKQAVFTTKLVMSGKSTILRVQHENDGYWQFLGDEYVTEDDALIVALGDMLELDKTLKDIIESVPMGKFAYRTSKFSPWCICDIEEDED